VTDGKIVKFCKKCGNTLEPKTSTIVFSTSFQKKEQSVVINKFTKLDPTLPRIYTIPCPNDQCENHLHEHPEIIVVRYDHSELKYIFICPKCDTSWKHNKE
jgi:DNA-directed RNA polymerase subunit M/transcription elongation factor TFIIS